MAEHSRKIALVVGGSRGIGRAVALRLARSGFDLWLTYKGNHAAAEAVRAEAEALGAACELLAFDVASFEAVEAALAERLETVSPDVLVYNSGITRDNLLMWMNREEWDAVLSTNLDGFFNVTRQVVFAMLKAKRGRIVVVSSTSGQVGQAGQVNYSASKAGLIGAAKALAREVGKKGVLVNVVAPGFIETDMTEQIPKAQVLPLVPLNRLGTVEDVASVVNFLCTEEHMYIHGQVIGINGGLVM
ncbi:MAG: 3-oxoacyl-ACP reductase FabG [Deltaproteobacteria bacterium]|nr:MAG: 3-oxoacyl-ACP reductase FabG [Deltaproteobacteria bacterium]